MRYRILFLTVMAALCAPPAAAQMFRHPMLFGEKKVEMIRILLSEQPEARQAAFLLTEHPLAQADYKPNAPFRVISRDGAFGYTKSRMEQDFGAAMLNALRYVITKDAAHAEKSLEILTIYADSLRYIPETNDAPLLAALEGFKIIFTLDILKYDYGKIANRKAKIAHIEKMFRTHFLPILEKFYATPPYTNGNWGVLATKTCMAAAIYFNDRKMYSFAKNFYLNGHDNGTIAHYIDGTTGQTQEAGRDQGHPQLALGAMAMVCELAWQQGDDLYAALDNRLLKGYEYIAQYNLGNEVPFRQWTDITGKYGNWTVISEKSRGSFKPIYEVAYNHYCRRRGFSMPYTKQVLEKIRPEAYDRDEFPFGSLFFNE